MDILQPDFGPEVYDLYPPEIQAQIRAMIPFLSPEAQAAMDDEEREKRIAAHEDYTYEREEGARRARAKREEALATGKLNADAEAFYELTLKPKLTEAHDFTPKVKKPIVEDLFNENSLCWVVGSSGTFKSFVTADLAFRYGTEDMDYHGRQMTHGRTLIIVAEGADGYAHRKTAWEREHDRTVKNVVIYPGALQLADVQKEMAALIHHLKQEKEAGRGYGLIMVDTQAMCTVGVDENKSEMNLVINVLHRIREASGACIMVVHHFGKDERKGMRGSSMLYAAADTVCVLKRANDAMDVTLSTAQADEGKQKDGVNEKDFLKLELKAHVVGENYFGKPVTSLVPVPASSGSHDVHELPDDAPDTLPVIGEVDMYYLRGIDTYSMDGAAPSALRERLGTDEYRERLPAPPHKALPQTAGNRLQGLKAKGLVEKVPGQKGWYRATSLGISVIAKYMIDRYRVESDWADRSARQGRFRGGNISGSEPGSATLSNQDPEPNEP